MNQASVEAEPWSAPKKNNSLCHFTHGSESKSAQYNLRKCIIIKNRGVPSLRGHVRFEQKFAGISQGESENPG